jgi:hypothetical protein
LSPKATITDTSAEAARPAEDHRVRQWAIIAGILCILLLAALFIILHYRLFDVGDALSSLISQVSTNLLASVIIAMILLCFLARLVPKAIGERIKIAECPVGPQVGPFLGEVGHIYRNVSRFERRTTDELRRKHEATTILRERLRILARQIEKLDEGVWDLVEDEEGALTDADLLYQLLNRHLLLERNNLVLRASTIANYTRWWYSRVGLNYLNANLRINGTVPTAGICALREHAMVERLFLLPDGAIHDLFAEIRSKPSGVEEATRQRLLSALATEETEGKKTLRVGHLSKLTPQEIMTVILLHHLLGFRIRVLTPLMIPSDPDKLPIRNRALAWESRDLALVERKGPGVANAEPIYGVHLYFSGIPEPVIMAKRGDICFHQETLLTDDAAGLDSFAPYWLEFASLAGAEFLRARTSALENWIQETLAPDRSRLRVSVTDDGYSERCKRLVELAIQSL